MKKGKSTYFRTFSRSNIHFKQSLFAAFPFQHRKESLLFCLLTAIVLAGCDFIKMKNDGADSEADRQPIARVENTYLYKDELDGIIAPGTTKRDSTVRVEAYINSWIRKQLLIREASL
jgi:hypothetical protein